MTHSTQNPESPNCAYCGQEMTSTHASDCEAFSGERGKGAPKPGSWAYMQMQRREYLAQRTGLPKDAPIAIMEKELARRNRPPHVHPDDAAVYLSTSQGFLLVAGCFFIYPGLLLLALEGFSLRAFFFSGLALAGSLCYYFKYSETLRQQRTPGHWRYRGPNG